MDHLDIATADGEQLHAVHLPGPAGARAVAVVLAHGFSGHSGKPAVQRIARQLATTAGVLAYNARGHGRSTGLSTLGAAGPELLARLARRVGELTVC